MKKATSAVDAYFAALPQPQRATLEKMRADILAAAPHLEQTISYGMPTFKDGPGYGIVGIAAFAKHCSLFPLSERIADQLGGVHRSGKGTLQFPHDKPPSAALIKKIVRARLAEEAERRAVRAAKQAAKKKTAKPAGKR